MAELEADTVVILSSELISKIVGEYFNKKMFRERVEIVDLRPTETGYMFSVAFAQKKVEAATVSVIPSYATASLAVQEKPVRMKNGQFASVKVKE